MSEKYISRGMHSRFFSPRCAEGYPSHPAANGYLLVWAGQLDVAGVISSVSYQHKNLTYFNRESAVRHLSWDKSLISWFFKSKYNIKNKLEMFSWIKDLSFSLKRTFLCVLNSFETTFLFSAILQLSQLENQRKKYIFQVVLHWKERASIKYSKIRTALKQEWEGIRK